MTKHKPTPGAFGKQPWAKIDKKSRIKRDQT